MVMPRTVWKPACQKGYSALCVKDDFPVFFVFVILLVAFLTITMLAISTSAPESLNDAKKSPFRTVVLQRSAEPNRNRVHKTCPNHWSFLRSVDVLKDNRCDSGILRVNCYSKTSWTALSSQVDHCIDSPDVAPETSDHLGGSRIRAATT